MLSSIRKRADVFFRSVKTRDDVKPYRSGLHALYRKELADHLRSRRGGEQCGSIHLLSAQKTGIFKGEYLHCDQQEAGLSDCEEMRKR